MQVHLVQYVAKKSMEVDYNILLVQNHVHYNYVVKKITLWGGGANKYFHINFK